MTISYTGDALNIAITSVGTPTGTTGLVHFAGRAYLNGNLQCSNSAPAAGAVVEGGWAVNPDGRVCVTKAAINASDLVMFSGRAFTIDGRAYVSTAAASGVVAHHRFRYPYLSTGELKVSEK